MLLSLFTTGTTGAADCEDQPPAAPSRSISDESPAAPSRSTSDEPLSALSRSTDEPPAGPSRPTSDEPPGASSRSTSDELPAAPSRSTSDELPAAPNLPSYCMHTATSVPPVDTTPLQVIDDIGKIICATTNNKEIQTAIDDLSPG